MSESLNNDGILWTALIGVLERLRSKNRNPDNEWYHGWNAAIQCLINDANARSASAAVVLHLPSPQSEETAREIVLYMNQKSGHAEGDEWFGEGDVKAIEKILAKRAE